MTFSLQRCMPWYQVKNTRKLPKDNKNVIDSSFVSNVIAKVITKSFFFTFCTYDNNCKNQLFIVTV